jgi:uncharacterized protein YjbI with pentapeptide repeats
MAQMLLLVIVMACVLLGIAATIIGGYRFRWAWTGFSDYKYRKNEDEEFQRGKTLWDWLQLLLIPAALAGIALLFNQWQSDREEIRADQRAKTDQAIAADGLRQETLQRYLDGMSELILDRKLLQSKNNSDVRVLARTRTLSALRGLDGARKGTLILFLREAGLINGPTPVVDLDRANLSEAQLRGAFLPNVHLDNVRLTGADLAGASLARASLNNSHLDDACLWQTNLADAKLSDVTFERSDLFGTNLSNATGRNINFIRADLSAARLSIAKLTNSYFLETIINEFTDFNGPAPSGVTSDRSSREPLSHCRWP